MHEYWKKVHDEALAGMRRVTGQEVEDTIAAINAQTKQLMGMTGLIINAPAMAASEAAASAFKANATATSNG